MTAMVRRKPKTQQRFVELAEAPNVSAMTTGHICAEIPQGVEFTIQGGPYDYLIGMSFEEWDKLVASIHQMRDIPNPLPEQDNPYVVADG